MSMLHTRWAAIGAAIAVSLGAGGLGIVNAAASSGERAVFVPITPCRLFDTRSGSDNVGPKSNPMQPGETYTFAVHGNNGACTGIPADALSVSLNVTALNATAGTFLTVWAADAPRPLASNLNPTPGQPPTPNGVTADLSADGHFNVYNLAGTVDVLADVDGYYVDHNHDDRYVRLPEGALVVNVSEFLEVDPTDAWIYGGFWSHAAGADSECLYAPVSIPAGRTLTRVVVSYSSSAGANPLSVSVPGIRNTPGAATGILQPVSANASAPATAFGTVGEVALNLPAGSLVAADRSYVAFVCTDDTFSLLGYRIELA